MTFVVLILNSRIYVRLSHAYTVYFGFWCVREVVYVPTLLHTAIADDVDDDDNSYSMEWAARLTPLN